MVNAEIRNVSYSDAYVYLSVAEPTKEEYERIGTEVIVYFGSKIFCDLTPKERGGGPSLFASKHFETTTIHELILWLAANQHRMFVCNKRG